MELRPELMPPVLEEGLVVRPTAEQIVEWALTHGASQEEAERRGTS